MVDWRPGPSLAGLHLRARMRNRVRTFFAATGALEVETPIAGTTVPAERALDAVQATINGRPHLLRTSPEAAMKRLLAAGVGDCWQLGPVFRDGEQGRHHQPEFTLLEWYRLGYDHHELMDEVEAVVIAACAGECEVPPARRLSWQAAFGEVLGLDPFDADQAALRAAAHDAGIGEVVGLAADDRDGLLDWLLAAAVVPALTRDCPLFVHGWPVAQAALARPDADDPRTAARFELYWQGVELANGFRELADADEQRRRLEAERTAIGKRGGAVPPVDESLLAALAHGLPACAGVALGFDRLVMLAAGAQSLDEVIAFGFERC